jgi:hypothetical protein
MCNILEIADKADIIINGYAFTKNGKYIKILNLNHSDRTAVLNETELFFFFCL